MTNNISVSERKINLIKSLPAYLAPNLLYAKIQPKYECNRLLITLFYVENYIFYFNIEYISIRVECVDSNETNRYIKLTRSLSLL